MTTDLADWLAGVLDQVEATAKAASDCGETWTFNDGGGQPHLITGSRSDGYGNNVIVYDAGSPDDGQAAHIATWDPARVLGLVAGARKLLKLHKRWVLKYHEVPDQWWFRCGHCFDTDESYLPWPCPTILTVAEMFGVPVETSAPG